MDQHHENDLHDHDLGLAHDLSTMLGRRRLLTLFGGAGALAVIAGCGSSSSTSSSAATDAPATAAAATTTTASATTAATATTAAATTAATAASDSTAAASGDLTAVPEETAGPYPGDGSNGPDVLTATGIVRSDIRPSFGDYSGTAEGVDSTISLTLVDASTGNPLTGAAVYLWHCDRDGRYSLYTAQNENYLRGVQEADANGTVTFTTIFPACYSGRWPHIHYEVYSSLADATSAGTKVRTSQIALPEGMCATVYAGADGYSSSVTNLGQVSLATDNVFRDGWTTELATATGSVADGIAIALTAAI